MEKYDGMLNKAFDELPEVVHTKQRFEIPNVLGHIQGNITVISNITQITKILRRNMDHLVKFLLKELATAGKIKNNSLLLASKIPSSRINAKIKQYAEEFVLCPICGKPDTDLIKEKDITYLRCNACGAKTPVKTLM